MTMLNPMNEIALPTETVEHYVPDYEITVRVARKPALTTVAEFDWWGVDCEERRCALLLDVDLNASLHVQQALADGDPRMLRALLKLHKLSALPEALRPTGDGTGGAAMLVLGYDFCAREPRITILG